MTLDELCKSKTFLMIHGKTDNVIGYYSLATDTIKLTIEEKTESDLDEVQFMSLPALKVGKLAINKKLSGAASRKGYGSSPDRTISMMLDRTQRACIGQDLGENRQQRLELPVIQQRIQEK